MRLQRLAGNTFLMLVSLAAAVLLGELVARRVLNPADYLSVDPVADEALGIRIAPGTPGFDELGFRNESVPSRVDVVAVGDSHTYGNNAKMNEAWPAVVGSVARLQVYNFGMGGYGPNQYYEVLRRHLDRLQPRWVICGLYLGDDFENAFAMTYGKDYWKSLRAGSWSSNADIWNTSSDDLSWSRRARVWLSSHSLMYRLAVHGPLLGQLKGAFQIQQASRSEDFAVTTISLSDVGVKEAFRPSLLRVRLDQRSPYVREGMRITFELLKRMNQLAAERGAKFAVVVIPTKETVFAEHLLKDPQMHLRGAIQELVTNEAAATADLRSVLDDAGIPYVEAREPLRRHISEHLYTLSDQDMHPNQNGYRVIGETVARFLEEKSTWHASR
jgi:hypothetical protein